MNYKKILISNSKMLTSPLQFSLISTATFLPVQLELSANLLAEIQLVLLLPAHMCVCVCECVLRECACVLRVNFLPLLASFFVSFRFGYAPVSFWPSMSFVLALALALTVCFGFVLPSLLAKLDIRPLSACRPPSAWAAFVRAARIHVLITEAVSDVAGFRAGSEVTRLC